MLLRNFLLAMSGYLMVNCCNAFELNWADENWSGSTSATQFQTLTDVDGSGMDVSVSLVLSGASSFASSTSISGNNMILGVDYSDSNRQHNFIDVTISFSSMVQYVSLELNDVDKGVSNHGAYWEDVIENISGTGLGGPVTASATWGMDISPDSYSDPGETMYRGTGNNNWDAASRMTLTWQSPVSQVTFRYSGGNDTFSNPAYQVIGFKGIGFYEYSAVPEPSTYLLGAMGSITLAFSFYRKRKKKSMKNMPRL